jgi:thiol-disulfide isomerase/thioredoxin
MLVGCGGSESSTTVVPPPSPAVVETSPSPAVVETPPSDAAPWGGLQLPPGEIPPPESATTPPASGGIQMPKGVTLPVDSGATAEPRILYGSWEEIELTAKTSGRITVVDLWSLACEPCLKEFPGLVQLHQTQGGKVQCIAVDVDFDGRKTRPPEHYEPQVAEFLHSVGAAGFPTYICRTPSDDLFAATKLASIPAVLVYDASGELVKVFVDAGDTAGFTYAKDVVPLVARLAG